MILTSGEPAQFVVGEQRRVTRGAGLRHTAPEPIVGEVHRGAVRINRARAPAKLVVFVARDEMIGVGFGGAISVGVVAVSSGAAQWISGGHKAANGIVLERGNLS